MEHGPAARSAYVGAFAKVWPGRDTELRPTHERRTEADAGFVLGGQPRVRLGGQPPHDGEYLEKTIGRPAICCGPVGMHR
jgi:hypothetical protein